MTGSVEIRLLGRFAVLRDGVELPASAWGGRKVRTLVRVLAARQGRHVSHELLIEALWPDGAPADPAANLGVLVNRARRALADHDLISTGPGGYTLTGGCAVDAEMFRDQLGLARRAASGGDPSASLAVFERALAAWRGDPLPEDAFAEWSREIRDELFREHQSALEEASRQAVRAGDPSQGTRLAAAAVAGDPLREIAHLRLIEALAAAGDRAGALAAFDRLRRTLAEELGLDPSGEAVALQATVLADQPRSPAPRPKAASTPTAQPLGPTAQPPGATAQPPGPTAQPPFHIAEPPSRLGQPAGQTERGARPAPALALVGRRAELEALLSATQRPTDGRPAPVTVLSGPPGIGKSRLLAELADRHPGPVLMARAFLPERQEAWSLARSLFRAAAAVAPACLAAVPPVARPALLPIIPELAEQLLALDEAAGRGRPELDPQSRHALVTEAGVRLVGAVGSDALVLVDDLQWADPSSLQLLAVLLARIPELPAVVARREQLTGGSPGRAAGFVGDVAGFRELHPVRPAPLTRAELAEVLDPELAGPIVDSTEGRPMAVLEVVRALAAAHRLQADPSGRWRLPTGRDPAEVGSAAVRLGRAGLRRGIEDRARRHAEPAADLLALLSVLGRRCGPGLLASASGQQPDQVLAGLAELAADDLVQLRDGAWGTAHDLVAETVAGSLTDPGRARWHARLAGVLADGGDPAEVARHLAAAGDALGAAAQHARAARALLNGYANKEAAAQAEAGLTADVATGALRRELLRVRAEARSRLGDLAGARDDLRAAVAAGATAVERSGLLARLATLYSGAEDLDRASALAEAAILAAGADEPALAAALEVAAMIDVNLGRPDQARQRAEHALAGYRRLGDPSGAARIMDGRAMASFLDGEITLAATAFGEVADLFWDSGELLAVVTPRSTRGHALVFMARPDEGLAETDAALRLAVSLGVPESECYARWHRSEAFSALGRTAEAGQDARTALELANRLGHRGWTATAHRALGIALAGSGDWAEAATEFRRSLAAAEGLTLFASWAAARLAVALIRLGYPDQAAGYVELALSQGPKLAGYEARLAQLELAAAVDRPDAGILARAAAELAEQHGHRADLGRILELAEPPE